MLFFLNSLTLRVTLARVIFVRVIFVRVIFVRDIFFANNKEGNCKREHHALVKKTGLSHLA